MIEFQTRSNNAQIVNIFRDKNDQIKFLIFVDKFKE